MKSTIRNLLAAAAALAALGAGAQNKYDDGASEKLAREAIVTPIPEGTTQIQQLIIGRALTGVVAF